MFFRSKDTEYNGILYRSKLEAMWAMYFDEYRIKHKYEYKKIDLGIDKYTPDFWLPKYKVWVEIKPYKQWRPHSKCYRLALKKKELVLLIQGKPDTNYTVDLFDCRQRRNFSSVYRTRVSEDEEKPKTENLQFHIETECGESNLTLVDYSGEIFRLD